MTSIHVRYAALAQGHDGLAATWNRIEGHLAELEQVVGGTADMNSAALMAYRALKVRWTKAADDRQLALKNLAALVAQAGEQYRAVEARLAAQFG
ncbi:MAG: hypothetical protein M3Z00_08345 [Actinomycetota bacterium]|nr:hypothetical protein [Actinomycetota bacterium]